MYSSSPYLTQNCQDLSLYIVLLQGLGKMCGRYIREEYESTNSVTAIQDPTERQYTKQKYEILNTTYKCNI